MFSCEYCKIFNNTCFEEHLQTAASENDKKDFLEMPPVTMIIIWWMWVVKGQRLAVIDCWQTLICSTGKAHLYLLFQISSSNIFLHIWFENKTIKYFIYNEWFLYMSKIIQKDISFLLRFKWCRQKSICISICLVTASSLYKNTCTSYSHKHNFEPFELLFVLWQVVCKCCDKSLINKPAF